MNFAQLRDPVRRRKHAEKMHRWRLLTKVLAGLRKAIPKFGLHFVILIFSTLFLSCTLDKRPKEQPGSYYAEEDYYAREYWKEFYREGDN